MKKKGPSIDGFTPRQANNKLGDLRSVELNKVEQTNTDSRPIHTNDLNQKTTIGQYRPDNLIGQNSDLSEFDDNSEPTGFFSKLRHRKNKIANKKIKRPKKLIFRIIKWLSIITLICILAFGGYMLYKLKGLGENVFQGSILDIFKNQPLKQDNNGRSNFLILGTSEDDAGHDGANLTDSMMIISIDQNNNNVYMFSVPRDLYVKYGIACPAGYYGKINAYFSCINDGATIADEQDRLAKTQKFVGDIFGLDIQYGIHVNHSVIKEAVNAVGGIDVDVQGSNGDPGVYDRNFDWRCNYKCYLVKYDNGVHHLDGEHALFLSMARGDVAPTYGLGNSNFDREKNQQKILIALRDKALSTGTLTNINAIMKLIDSFGNNLRTNIQTNEIKTLMDVAGNIKSSETYALSLYGEDVSVFKTGNYDGASVVMPSAGIFNYSQIKSFIKKSITSDPIAKENASISVLNASGVSGYATQKAAELTDKGFNVTNIDNAPTGNYDTVEVYQISSGFTATANKLASTYGVTVKNQAPNFAVASGIDFVVIFGSVKQN